MPFKIGDIVTHTYCREVSDIGMLAQYELDAHYKVKFRISAVSTRDSFELTPVIPGTSHHLNRCGLPAYNIPEYSLELVVPKSLETLEDLEELYRV